MYLGAASKETQQAKTGTNLLNNLKGEKRFKTFRANNELYMRIDPVKSD